MADTDSAVRFILVLAMTLNFDTNCQALLPDLTGTNYIVASDNCSLVSVAQVPPVGTIMPVGTNAVILTVSDAASNQTTRAIAVIVPGEPHISLQPANLTAVVSSNALFSVMVCGAAPLAYQWQHAGTNLPAATNAMLTLTNITTGDAGAYLALVSNPAGSITSAVANLTVLWPPVITRQPKNVAAAPGGKASFSVSVEGRAPFTYQWQKNGSRLDGWTGATLSITNVQTQDFATYTVAITNVDGAAVSDPAMLTLAVSPIITSQGFNGDTLLLTIPTEVGPSYVVEYKARLDDPSWTVLTTIVGTGWDFPITDNGQTNTARFYRVRVR